MIENFYDKPTKTPHDVNVLAKFIVDSITQPQKMKFGSFVTPSKRVEGWEACLTTAIAKPPDETPACRPPHDLSLTSLSLRNRLSQTPATALSAGSYPDRLEARFRFKLQGCCSTSKDSLFFPGIVVFRCTGPAFTGTPVFGPYEILLTPELIAQLRSQYHLDEPFLTQYWIWLKSAVHGDLGDSTITGQPVTTST